MRQYLNEFKDFILVVFVGIVAYVLTMTPNHCKNIVCKFIRFFIGVSTSVFLNLSYYYFFYYFTDDSKFSLAVAGYLTWRGSDWVDKNVDKIIKSKIDQDRDT